MRKPTTSLATKCDCLSPGSGLPRSMPTQRPTSDGFAWLIFSPTRRAA